MSLSPRCPQASRRFALISVKPAMNWCERESANLMAAIRLAEDAGFLEIAWKLPSVLFSYFYIGNRSADWIASHVIGSRAAAKLADPRAESMMAHRLGVAYKEIGQFQPALPYFTTALRLRRELGDRAGEATALSNIGLCATGLGSRQRLSTLFTSHCAFPSKSTTCGRRHGHGTTWA
jgi:tetratricopeptide (TPR) repeat protein